MDIHRSTPLSPTAKLLCLLPLLTSSYPVLAASIPIPGTTVTVINPTSRDDYTITNRGTLNGTGNFGTINANNSTMNMTSSDTQQLTGSAGSTLNLTDTTVTATGSVAGVTLTDSTATLVNTTITSTRQGLILARSITSAGSQASVSGSTISGNTGIQVTSNSVLQLSGSQVTGTAAGAINLLGGAAVVSDSTLTGAGYGVRMNLDPVDASVQPSLSLNNSSLTSSSGPAILVDGLATASIEVLNGSVLTGGNGNILEVAGAGTANLHVQDSALTGDLQATGNSILNLNLDHASLTGDVTIEAGSTGDITLQNQAVFTGNLTNVGTLAVNSGANWNMVASASVQDLSMNDGRVNIGGTSAGGFRELTLGSLSGTGTFGLGTAVGENLGDLLNVTGNASGNYNLAIANTGVDPVAGGADLKVVHTGSGNATFAALGGQVDIGTFTYLLEKQGNDWFLVQQTDSGGGPVVSPGTRAVIGLFSAAPTVWYGELSTLRSRMGELRNGEDAGGFWMRGYGNKFNMDAGSGVNYSQTQQGISFGVDMPVPDSDGRWLIGLLGGYSNSDLNLQAGTSGQVNSYYLGAYSTWRSVDGYYVDAVLKANRFKNKADVVMSDGVQSKGNYNNNGLGASVEVGKHIDLHDGWFVEPFGQMNTLWVASDNYSLDNGMQARSNGADSYLGKVGSLVGRTIPMDHGGFIQPYVKAALAHEFAHANKVRVNDNSFSNDLSGSRGELGAGIAAQLTNVLQVHADIDYSNGQNIEQPWGVNVGLRYNF